MNDVPRTTEDITPLLTYAQIDRLLQPVNEGRLQKTQGLTYVPQQEVRAELSRVFGPGNWDSSIHDITLLYETFGPGKDGKERWTVGYRLGCTLRVRSYDGREIATFTEYHAEENAPQPNRGEAHALALTSCESYALRRAAIGLGDAFGLHLYAGGSTAPLVKWSLIQGEAYPAAHKAAKARAAEREELGRAAVNARLKKPEEA